MCDKYLELYQKEALFQILEDPDENKHCSLNIDFIELFDNDPNLGNSVLREPEKTFEEWDNALRKVEANLIEQSKRDFVFKKHVHCRIFGLPVCPELRRTILPLNEDANKFLQVSGTVIRMTSMRMLEYQRQYICAKCKYVMLVTAEYERRNIIVPPKKCGNPEGCPGTNIITTGKIDAEFCKDYQEIQIQENVSKLEVGCIPNSMWVTLEDDLVDSCKPGDNISVCGIVKRRWGQFVLGKLIDIELVIKANHIQVNNNSSATAITPELKDMFQAFWKTYSDRPLAARDIILKSICPQLFGLYLVKLAVAVVLAGGSHINDNTGTGVRVRADPHLLLVGDPGTGKSQLLRFASKIVPRSVLTTGVGSTAAGLTVTAVKENGEWQLEAGALVLSDGGICCIDEFNSMKEHDRLSIHEAMEQQSISVAKASIVCKLSTRCSILAATNPKGNLDPSQPLCMNVALASPLLSRFDLILLLRDKVNKNRDSLVADYILNAQDNTSKLTENINWTVEILQAYFSVIKKVHPVLTEDSNRILGSYYQAQRRKNSRNKSRTTVRLLDSLVRLSQGHARLMYHDEVQIIDAVTAVVLVETAMEADSSVVDLQFDTQSDFPESPNGNYRELVGIVLRKLQLLDLLEKELASVDKISHHKLKPNGNNPTVVHRTESRFFHQIQQKNENRTEGNSKIQSGGGVNVGRIKGTKENKDDNQNLQNMESNVNNNSPTGSWNSIFNDQFGFSDDAEIDDSLDLDIPQTKKNISKHKRENKTEGSSQLKTNKIQSTVSQNDVVNDLAVLNFMPSVNDHFSLFNKTEENLELDLSSGQENGNEIQSVNMKANESVETETKSNNNEKNKRAEDGLVEVPSQRSKRRKLLDKFRFVRKETDSTSETSVKQTSEPQEKKEAAEDISSSEPQEKKETAEDISSWNPLISGDILKELESVPQSTQCEKVKFKFKKIENLEDLPRPSTIFESYEDLENLDLDI